MGRPDGTPVAETNKTRRVWRGKVVKKGGKMTKRTAGSLGFALIIALCLGLSGCSSTNPGAPPADPGGPPPDPGPPPPPDPGPPPVTGSVDLAWTPPSTFTDGTPLSGLAGFRVYYGAASGANDHEVEAGTAPQCSIGGLAAGTWYFSVTAFTAADIESPLSSELSCTVE
jgi:hypothetical protein